VSHAPETALVVTLSVRELRALIAGEVRAALNSLSTATSLIDQRSSPLGPRRHAAAVRRRLEAGKPGASRVGRRWLLTPAALEDELTGPKAPDDPEERLRVRLAARR
jgi:hypothetical protein